MTSQLGKKAVAIHIFPNISRSKRNQATKFGHFMEYNMINSTQNGLEKLFPDPFLKN